MCTWLTAWRRAPDTAWLAGGPNHPQQQALRRMEAAFKRFFEAARAGQSDGRGCVKPPRFKARGQEPGLRFLDPKQFELDAVNSRQACLRQPVDGALHNFSRTREGTGPGARWHVALQVECAHTRHRPGRGGVRRYVRGRAR
jgi:putative transposase